MTDFKDFKRGDIIECVTIEQRHQPFQDGRDADGNIMSAGEDKKQQESEE